MYRIKEKSELEDPREAEFTNIVQYVDEHIMEKFSVKFLCKHFGMSKRCLNELFLRYDELSFYQYLIQYRLQTAKKILRSNPEMLVCEVAEKVGFTDPFYFSRVFRANYGLSPSAYKKQKYMKS